MKFFKNLRRPSNSADEQPADTYTENEPARPALAVLSDPTGAKTTKAATRAEVAKRFYHALFYDSDVVKATENFTEDCTLFPPSIGFGFMKNGPVHGRTAIMDRMRALMKKMGEGGKEQENGTVTTEVQAKKGMMKLTMNDIIHFNEDNKIIKIVRHAKAGL